MYRTAKVGFPLLLCLVAVTVFTCGKDSPTGSSVQEAPVTKAAARPQDTASSPQATTDKAGQPVVTGRTSQSVGQATSPDYVIESVEVSETSLSAGERFTMTATVKNQGADYPGFALATLRFYRSADASISTADTEIGTRPILPLDANETREWSLPVLNAPSVAGTYYYGACVDPLPEESDQQNNCSVAVTVSVGGPDLVVDSLAVSETSLSAGQRFTMTARVRNQGAGATVDLTTLRFYQSADATISTDDTELGTRSILPLDPDETRAWSLPALIAPSTAGTYYYGACVDPLTVETDQQNNCSAALALSVGGPDLVVDSLAVSETNLSAGQRFSMSATVRNQGAGGSISLTTVRFYRSTDATISTADTELDTRPILPLDPDETRAWSLPLLYAPSMAGTYFYGACVDALPEETDPQNNCSVAVAVSLKTADLIVERPTVSDVSSTAGGRFSLSATVRNQGGGDAIAWTTLRFYQSGDASISTSDTEVGTWAISPLVASGSQERTLRFLSLPSDGGTYYYGACVDPLPGEADTANNCSGGVTITVSSPDLVVDAPIVSERNPAPGEQFDLSATVRNQGGGDAASSTTLRYYRSNDASITDSDAEIGTDFVIRLDAAATAEESISLTASDVAGTYYYGACVDALDNETGTGNNCSAGVAVTVGQTANQPPVARGMIPDQEVDGGESVTVDVSSYFTDPDGDTLTYEALTSDAAVATAFIPGSVVMIRGVSAGNATITITASDGSLTAGQPIRVTVLRSVVPLPDLIVESPSVSDGSPEPGERFTFRATVRNRGDGDASSSTTLRYYRSADATISVADTEIGTDRVVSLDSSETSDESIALNAPSDAGTYYYGACVDALSDESDTQNNCSVAVTVTVGQPVNQAPVAQGTIPAQNVDVGESVRIAVTTYFSDPDGDRLTYSAATSDSAVATAATSGSVVTVEGESAGNATITVTADDGSLTARQTIRVTVQNPVVLAPDLVVESPTASEDQLSSGERFRLSATVRNQGDGRGSSTTLRYYLSTDAAITSGDTEVGTDYVSSLRASSTSGESISLNAPATLGTYYYGACVDALSEESDTGNNCSAAIMVTVDGPDLIVGSPTVSESNPQAGDAFTLSVTVTNQGAGDASSSTTLRYYRSNDTTISSGDTEVGTDHVSRLDAAESGDEWIALTAPDAAGTFYYGACVEATSGETNTGNNCSGAVSIDVMEKPTIVGADSYAYLTQSVQSVGDPVALIEGDDALLRVFLARDGDDDIAIPPVRATFYNNGSVAHEVDIPGKSASIPAQIEEGVLDLSSNALIPGSVIEPGLEMVVEVDPDSTLDAALGIARRIPPSGRTTVDVRTVRSFDILAIPYLWEENPDRSILTEINAITAGGELLRETRDYLPVGDITFDVHDPVFVSYDPTGDHAEELISLTESIRDMEDSEDTYYMGVFRRRGDNGVLGIAYVGGYFLGLNREYSSVTVLQGPVIAHEFGHNLSLRHAPCGGPSGTDSNYPESDGSIGAWGYDFSRQELISPSRPDLMSYCEPEWIGYYSFSKALQWRQAKDVRLAASPSTTLGLMLWGHVDASGDLVLEPAFAVEAPPDVPQGGGPYRLTGQSADGNVLFDVSFELNGFGDVGGGGFNFILPVRADWPARLDQITLSGPEGVVIQDKEGDRAAALLLDRTTGQVRGFLHDWAVTVAGTPPARRVLPEPGLEVITSQGVPGATDW
ncbi:MAG: M66 family metalloprotease [Gemmatimonadetes bacterium]|nr:M66 family metalloprotease [Gemmatimonadota bacterium]